MIIRRALLAFLETSSSGGASNSSCGTDCAAVFANASEVCADTLSNATLACLDEDDGEGIFGLSYLLLYRCNSPAVLLFIVPWLLMLLMALGSTADNFLMPQLHYLSNLLRLSPDVAGVTLLALGNGAPDVVTAAAVATASRERMDMSLTLSDIVGG